MNKLKECKEEYECWARDIDYKNTSKNDLMRCLKWAKLNDDEDLQVQYLSALMLKYWYKIDLMWKDWNKKGMSNLESEDDIVCWIKQGILEALDSYIKFGEEKLSPEKIIERCCYQVFVSNCRYYELDLHKANVFTNSLNIVAAHNNGTEQDVELIDILPSDKKESNDYYSTKNCDLINQYNSSREYYKAIVVDLITNYDVLNQDNTVKECSIFKSIKSMTEDYINRYKYMYNTDITNTVNSLKKAKDKDLKELISYTIDSLREDVRGWNYVG